MSLYQPRIFTAWIASALNFIRCRKSWNKFRQLVFFMNKFTIPHTLLKLQQSPDRKRVRPKKPILLLLHHSLLSNLCFCVITFWSSTFISDCIQGSPSYKRNENNHELIIFFGVQYSMERCFSMFRLSVGSKIWYTK